MSAHMDRLMMTIGLIDQATAPLQGIQSAITQTADAGRIGWEKMAGGTAGLVAAGFAVQAALMPAIEMDRALGEVKSLGVVDADLQKLQQTALSFSAEFGKSATDVIQHAGLIKDYMGDMSGDVLASVTRSSSVLAVAMKSDADTVNSYMKTLYGNYQGQADAMGKDVWAGQIAGMTAEARKLYGVEMGTLGGMVDGMHSLTSTLGVGLPEQIAVLGELQKRMSEGDAVTQYTNFLEGAAGAQDKLGISLTNSQGELLPMMDILHKIGPLINNMTGIEARTLLDDAGLGDGSLMLINLVENMGQFGDGLNALNNVKGLDPAENMAGAMTDQWQRLEASWYAIRAGVFGLILPAINGVVGVMADGMGTVLEWTQMFPNITEYLGYAALAIVGGAGALAAWNLIVGLSTLVTAGWASAVGVMSGVMSGASAALTWMKGAFIGLNMTMAANPILWVVAGIVALGVAVVGIIVYWDELTAALNKIWIFNQIGQMFKAVGNSVMSVINDLVFAWDLFTSVLLNTAFVQSLMSGFGLLSNYLSGLFAGFVSIASGAWELIGTSVSALLLPFQVVFTLIKSFFSLLIDGPAAALAVLGSIPALFGGIADSVMSGWKLIASGVSTVVSHLFSAILFLAQPFILVGQQAMMVFGLMAQGWADFTSVLGDLSVFDLLGEGINWLIEKINMIPGIEIEPLVKEPLIPDVESLTIGNHKARSERINRPISRYLQGTQTAQVPTYGYMPQMAKAMQGSGSKSMHTGDIHIKQEQPFTRAQLHEWNEMDTP